MNKKLFKRTEETWFSKRNIFKAIIDCPTFCIQGGSKVDNRILGRVGL